MTSRDLWVLGMEDAQGIHAYIVDRAHWTPGILDIARGLVARAACVPPQWIAD